MNGTESTKQAVRPLIEVTPEALAQFRTLLDDPAHAGRCVRLGVRGGGCSGFSYVMDFDEERPGDHRVEIDGVTFLLDRKSVIYLKNIRVCYEGGLRGRGFVFENPNARNTCGCGESFSI
ncbi:MAG TPA: iron-sulfur cluster assembly accessory protein [Candidatus Hydrogenedentes bacterium]|nr:iron-sulfur cluster assembly accessory protein [Candidatus Hydrogenedentota bacterium]